MKRIFQKMDTGNIITPKSSEDQACLIEKSESLFLGILVLEKLL